MRKVAIILFCLVMANAYAGDQDLYPFTSQKESQRFTNLTNEIRCVVCQNQNIADSNSPLATDLREKVYQMVLDQQSDEVIKSYLVKRYGEFILFKPALHSNTLFLWFFPALALIISFLCLYRFLKPFSRQ